MSSSQLTFIFFTGVAQPPTSVDFPLPGEGMAEILMAPGAAQATSP